MRTSAPSPRSRTSRNRRARPPAARRWSSAGSARRAGTTAPRRRRVPRRRRTCARTSSSGTVTGILRACSPSARRKRVRLGARPPRGVPRRRRRRRRCRPGVHAGVVERETDRAGELRRAGGPVAASRRGWRRSRRSRRRRGAPRARADVEGLDEQDRPAFAGQVAAGTLVERAIRRRLVDRAHATVGHLAAQRVRPDRRLEAAADDDVHATPDAAPRLREGLQAAGALGGDDARMALHAVADRDLRRWSRRRTRRSIGRRRRSAVPGPRASRSRPARTRCRRTSWP